MREQHADHLQYRFDGEFDGGRPRDGALTVVGFSEYRGGVLNEYSGVWARPAASTDASSACQLHWKTQRKTQEFSIKV